MAINIIVSVFIIVTDEKNVDININAYNVERKKDKQCMGIY